MTKPQAVVLAAGLSSRAGTNKMALEVHGVPVLIRTVKVLLPYCSKVVVVTGHYKEEVQRLMVGIDGVTCVHNPDYMAGMFTSVKAGVAETTGDFFLTPGDYPMLQATTIQGLMDVEGDIRVPTIDGRGGHPIYISHRLKASLMAEPVDSNLKVFRNRYPVTWVPVEDPGAILDLDTMADYQKIQKM